MWCPQLTLGDHGVYESTLIIGITIFSWIGMEICWTCVHTSGILAVFCMHIVTSFVLDFHNYPTVDNKNLRSSIETSKNEIVDAVLKSSYLFLTR